MLAALLAAANFIFGYYKLTESLSVEKRCTLKRADPFVAITRVIKLPALNTLLIGYLVGPAYRFNSR